MLRRSIALAIASSNRGGPAWLLSDLLTKRQSLKEGAHHELTP